MKAILLEKPGQFRRVEIDEPSRPGVGEALVRVHRVGICGSDVSGYLGKMPFYSYPRIPGHELGVEVLAVGPDVTHVKPGDRCSVEPYINCQECFACQHGGGNCCKNIRVLGVHTDGGLREQFIVPARKLHKSDRLTFDQLALVETLAIGCHAVNRGAPKPAEQVLVIGAGPIGLAVIEFVKLTGAQLTVMDMNPRRLDYCRRVMGVQNTVEFKGDGSELKQLEEITRGALMPMVFDATGNPKSMCGAFQYVAHTGRMVFVGIVTADISFADPLFHAREVTLYASRNALPADFSRIIGLIEQGRIDTRPWITHRSPFDQLIADFPTYTKPDTGVIKAMIEVM
ncbi:MAG: zinc-binding alcohol dehydrogenase family protein [Bacillota bacterium]